MIFSKPITGFNASSITVGNATVETSRAAAPTTRSTSSRMASGRSRPRSAGTATDAAGNTNTASNAFSRVFQVDPVATIYSTAPANTTSTDVPVYIQFNEPVRLSASGITVVQGSIQGAVTQVSPTTYLFHVKPTLPSGQQSTAVTVTLLQLAATDAFGNQNQGFE